MTLTLDDLLETQLPGSFGQVPLLDLAKQRTPVPHIGHVAPQDDPGIHPQSTQKLDDLQPPVVSAYPLKPLVRRDPLPGTPVVNLTQLEIQPFTDLLDAVRACGYGELLDSGLGDVYLNKRLNRTIVKEATCLRGDSYWLFQFTGSQLHIQHRKVLLDGAMILHHTQGPALVSFYKDSTGTWNMQNPQYYLQGEKVEPYELIGANSQQENEEFLKSM